MKKLLALVLALVMMFAVCVPAFAAVTTEGVEPNQIKRVTGAKGEKQTVQADLHTSNELPAGEYVYEITIPADTEIAWDAEQTEFTYRIIRTQLAAGKRLQVAVKSENFKNTGVRKLTSDTTAEYIPYTYSRYDAVVDEYVGVDDLSYTTNKEVITAQIPRSFFITIDKAAGAWNVPLDTYKDQLNFVIDIVDAEVAPVEP